MRLILVLPLMLAGCSDIQLHEAAARHRTYVCSHQTAVTAAANLALSEADKIKDANIRAAAIAAAQGELALIATCPPVTP